MKTANECFTEAQKAPEHASNVVRNDAEVALRYTEIAHAWLQVARDLGGPAA